MIETLKSGAHHVCRFATLTPPGTCISLAQRKEAERGLPEVSQEHGNYPLRRALRQWLRALSCHRLCIFDVYSIRSWAQRQRNAAAEQNHQHQRPPW